MPTRKLYSIATTAAVVLALGLRLQASIDRGVIQGTVIDQQGGVVPGAKVTVKNSGTSVEVHLTTNSVGFYSASELVPGVYSVHVQSAGFSPIDLDQVTVSAGTTTTADVRLQVGSTSQLVEVTAAAPLVESTASNFTTASLGD